jgi:hypothetical protein
MVLVDIPPFAKDPQFPIPVHGLKTNALALKLNYEN